MKKYFSRWMAAIILMGIALPAFATTATIESSYSHYELTDGETVNLMGRCTTKAAEGVNSAEWTIDGVWSKATDGPPKGVHYKSFVAHGPVGHEIHVKFQCMTDMSMWFSNDSAERTFTIIDAEAPTITWDASNAAYAKKSITIRAVIIDMSGDVGQTWIRWPVAGGWSAGALMTEDSDAGYQKNVSYSIDVSALPEGVKNVQIWSEDQEGNNTGWRSKGSFTVDRSAPTIGWDNTNPQYAKDSITINANVSDAVSGVADVWISWPGEASRNIRMNKVSSDGYQYIIDTSEFPKGAKDVWIWAKDKAGNNTSWQVKGSFIVDRLPPKIEWDESNAQYTKDKITIKANVSDTPSGVANVWIWWTGAPSTNIKMEKGSGNQYEYTIPAMQADGVKDVQIWATDNAGNSTDWVSKGSFIVDHLPPKIEWDESNAQYTNDEITIKTNVSDTPSGIANVWIWWTGAPSQDIKMKKGSGDQYEYTIPAIQEDGVKDVQIYATDNVGNTIGWVSKGSFIVDRTPPLINWLEPLDQAVLSDGRIHVAGNIVDDNPDYVVIEWQAENAATWQSHTVAADPGHNDFQYDLSGLTQGLNYRLRLRATDKAGNDADDTPSRTVIGQLPADTMLRLQLESMQADWKYTQGTAFDYRITVRALKSALSGIALRYALPAGLQKNGDVRIDGDGAAAMRLNPHWGGRDALLLTSVHGAMLAARNAFTVTIPVRVANTAISGTFIQSEVQASANNLIGRISAMHRITLEGPPFDEEQLRLKKTVDKKTALPGEILHYTITFTNVSTEDLNTLVIKDDIQSAYLTLRNAQCGQSMPDSLQCCVSSKQGEQCGTAIVQNPGALEWHLNGKLAAGDSGSVSYEAQVRQH